VPLGIYIREGVSTEVRDTSPRTASYILYYHYVFRTKYNRPVLTEAVAGELLVVLAAVCEERGYLLCAAAAMPDHVHVVLSLKPATPPAEPMQYVKGRLSRELRRAFPELAGPALWAGGYYVEAVGKKNIHQVLHYVSRQDEHHDGAA
jgi:putative transposase